MYLKQHPYKLKNWDRTVTPSYCDIFPVEINNKIKYKFINHFFPARLLPNNANG